jgi:hypothetical protein
LNADPDPATQINADPVTDPDPKPWWIRIRIDLVGWLRIRRQVGKEKHTHKKEKSEEIYWFDVLDLDVLFWGQFFLHPVMWIRIPALIWSAGSGCGFRRSKITHKTKVKKFSDLMFWMFSFEGWLLLL